MSGQNQNASPEWLLTVAEMGRADQLAVAAGRPGIVLMENAGRSIADVVSARGPQQRVVVLCGPGNNGGDGYIAAQLLKQRGFDVAVAALGDPAKLDGDAKIAFERWSGPVGALDQVEPPGKNVMWIDALFGAGLARPLGQRPAALAEMTAGNAENVLAVDVPSGVDGTTGRVSGPAFHAGQTVTFFRRKPGHLLFPGRAHCGQITLADIGIPASVLKTIRPQTMANAPGLWRFPMLEAETHKYRRGHVLAVAGGAWSGGAARLAARGALRAGAGLVTLACPIAALPVNAAHLNAIMLAPFEGPVGLAYVLDDKRRNAVVLGPGMGVGEETRDLVLTVLKDGRGVVLDADALTSFEAEPKVFFNDLHTNCVLTPHEGEFERLFEGLLKKGRLEATREAARRAGAVVVLKGPDTIIAAPDGRAAINENAPPWLATAGSGDVLAGFIAGLLAQGMDAFGAAGAGVWLHGEAGRAAGAGLISEDLPEACRSVFQRLLA